jgi:hypothetical protein
MDACIQCATLLEAALQSSKLYHDLLGTLEAALISRNWDLASQIQIERDESLSRRDDAIKILERHRRAHSKQTAA